MIKVFGYTVFLIIVVIFMLEMSVRLFVPIDNPVGLVKTDPDCLYVNRPNFNGKDRYGNKIKINSYGLRDYEYPQKEKPRILIIGDSVTFGDGVSVDNTFSKILERLFDGNLEVLNGGVRGYNTVLELRWLKKYGLKLEPDIIILAHVENDAQPIDSYQGLIDPQNKFLVSLKEFLRTNFYSYAIIRREIDVLRNKKRSVEMFGAGEKQFAEDHPGWIASKKALTEMHNIAMKNNIRFIVLTIPHLNGLDEPNYWNVEIHDRVVNFLKSENIETLDILSDLQAYRSNKIQFSSEDVIHPSPFGHKIIGNEIFNYLRN